MEERIAVEFTIKEGKRDEFINKLQQFDAEHELCVGFRADDYVQRREALVKFVNEMEMKLRKNDHKTNWREKPIEALVGLMTLEVREFLVALEHFAPSEARPELLDIANFALINWDRLGMVDQNEPLRIKVTP